MKVIPLYNDDKSLISKAMLANKTAQRCLFDKYAPAMLGLCRRYVRDLQYAEDVMLQGFLKAFLHLPTFEGKGSFEGWLKRIMVHESINFLKKKKPIPFDGNLLEHVHYCRPSTTLKTDAEYLVRLIDELPHSYRLVFLLHAIEGYRHGEIAQMLEFSKNTSRSKLSKARKMLREKLELQRKRNGAF